MRLGPQPAVLNAIASLDVFGRDHRQHRVFLLQVRAVIITTSIMTSCSSHADDDGDRNVFSGKIMPQTSTVQIEINRNKAV